MKESALLDVRQSAKINQKLPSCQVNLAVVNWRTGAHIFLTDELTLINPVKLALYE